MGFSIPHLAMVLAIVILVFGTKRLKTVGSDLGDAIKGFRKAVKDGEQDDALSHQEDKAPDGIVIEQSKASV